MLQKSFRTVVVHVYVVISIQSSFAVLFVIREFTEKRPRLMFIVTMKWVSRWVLAAGLKTLTSRHTLLHHSRNSPTRKVDKSSSKNCMRTRDGLGLWELSARYSSLHVLSFSFTPSSVMLAILFRRDRYFVDFLCCLKNRRTRAKLRVISLVVVVAHSFVLVLCRKMKRNEWTRRSVGCGWERKKDIS